MNYLSSDRGDKMKVSVIIPVYNCKQYLEPCIESLLKQTLEECEFIFINDGSKDGSLLILQKYQAIDSRIKVINQSNRGVSAARNAGLEIANGDYIGFVDADDFVDADYFEKLYEVSIKYGCDITICDWKVGNESNDRLNLPFTKDIVLDRRYIEMVIYPFLIQEESLNSVCNKLYSADLIEKNRISFPTGVALGEDNVFNISAFTHVNASYYMNYCGYHYREVEGSATRNVIDKDYFQQALSVYKKDLEVFKKWNFPQEKIKELKERKLINSVISLTYIYFTSQNSFLYRYKYVREMIGNEAVKEILDRRFLDFLLEKGRYEAMLLKLIKRRQTFGVYCLTLYSKVRNGV